MMWLLGHVAGPALANLANQAPLIFQSSFSKAVQNTKAVHRKASPDKTSAHQI
jgi:hypothetical protein